MITLSMIEGPTVYVDPFHVQMVSPAFAAPDAGIPQHMQIPKTIGSRVCMSGGLNVVVKELPDRVAAAVEKATGRAQQLIN